MKKDFAYKFARCISNVVRHVPSTRPMANIAYDFLMYGKRRKVDIKLEVANNLLKSVHEDVESSAVCSNKIFEYQYDLQIVMPVYNVEKQLEQCIRSVLGQSTRFSYQLVIINDGSPDHSDEIIKKFESIEHIRVIRQENKGFSGARNAGLSEIQGKYVMFVDSDDILANDAIESLMDIAYSDDADIVEGNYIRMKNGTEKYIHCHDTEHINASVKLGQPWAKVFRAELFRNTKYPEKYLFEDTIGAFLLYPLAKRVSSIDKPVYKYFINPKGISTTIKGRAETLDSLYITRAMLKDCARRRMFDNYKQQLYEHMFCQIKVNFDRTSLLGEEIRLCVFVVTCELMENYFKGCHTQLEKNKPLELSLKEHNYKTYMLNCLKYRS